MASQSSSKCLSRSTSQSCSLEEQISRELTSAKVRNSTHVIHGLQGIGKTKLAHSIATNSECRTFFPDGIVWIGIGFHKPIDYENLIILYRAIFSQIDPSVAEQPDFEGALFVPSTSSEKSEEDEEKERRAMWDARDIMGRKIGHKKILLCLDGLKEVGDVNLFHFNSGDKMVERQCRVLITASGAPNESHEIKGWEIKRLDIEESKKLLAEEIGSRENYFMFLNKFDGALQLCQGIPVLIRALGKMFNDQYQIENQQSLQCIADTINQLKGNKDHRTRLFTVLEATVSNIMLENQFSRMPWVCFEAFTLVFTREECYRPWIQRAAVLTLFRAVISKVLKSETDPPKLQQLVNKLVDKFVGVGMLKEISGSNDEKNPQQFYQVQNDMYQNFGQKSSSASTKTQEKLHQTFVEDSLLHLNGQSNDDRSTAIDLYMLRWLPFHLIGANLINETARTLKSPTFIRKRIKSMGASRAAKEHKTDSEKLLGNITNLYARESKLLPLTYGAFLMVLKDEDADKENVAGCVAEEIIQAIWIFSYSLFLNNFVNDGYEMLRAAREIDSKAFTKFIGINMNSIHPFCSVNCDDQLNSARALIKLGSTMAPTKKKQEAIDLLQVGLCELQQAVGGGISLESARARMFVGEIFYDLKLYLDALENFRMGLPVLREVLGENSEELFDALLLIAKAYFRVGDLDTSIGILKCIATKVKGSTAVSVKLKIGEILMLKRCYKKSILSLESAKKETSSPHLLKRINDSILRVESKSARLNAATLLIQ